MGGKINSGGDRAPCFYFDLIPLVERLSLPFITIKEVKQPPKFKIGLITKMSQRNENKFLLNVSSRNWKYKFSNYFLTQKATLRF